MWKRKVQLHFEHLMEDSLDERSIHDVVKALSSKIRSRRRKSVARLADLSQDSTNRELMVKDGALEPLIKLLERDEGEHQSHALATLSSLASSHAYLRKELLAAGIVPATLPLLANDNPDIKCGAACVLYHISCDREGGEQIIDAGAGAELSRMLFRGETSYEEWVIQLIGNLIQDHPQMMQIIAQSGGVGRLVSAASTSSGSRVYAVRVLALILEADSKDAAGSLNKGEVQTMVLTAGGIPLMIEALTPVSGDREMGKWAIRGLARISMHDPSRQAIFTYHGVQAIVQMLWEDDQLVQESAAKTVAFLASSPVVGIEQSLSKSVPPLREFLDAPSNGLRQWSAKAIGNLAELGKELQMTISEEGTVEKLVRGLDAQSHWVKLAMVSALESLIKDCPANQDLAMTCGAMQGLCRIAFGLSNANSMVKIALGVMSMLCSESVDSQRVVVEQLDGIKGLLTILSNSGEDLVVSARFRMALKLLEELVQAPETINQVRSEFLFKGGMRLLSAVFEVNDPECQSTVMKIIFRIADGSPEGVIDGSLRDSDINNMVQALRSDSESCRAEAANTLATLADASFLYSAQIISSGGLAPLVELSYSGNINLMTQAAKALTSIARGSQENRTLVAEANAVPPLVFMMDMGNEECANEAVRALAAIAEEDQSNLLLLSHEPVLEPLVSRLKGADGEKARDVVVLLSLLSRTLTPKEAQMFEERAVHDVIEGLKEMVTAGDSDSQIRALKAMKGIADSPVCAQESILGTISSLVIFLIESKNNAVRQQASSVLSQMAYQVKVLAPNIREGGLPVLIPFLKGSSPAVGEQALDAMLKVFDQPKEGEESPGRAFCQAGGIRPLANVMTFGTMACKWKSAALVAELAKDSLEFCEMAVRDGLVTSLVRVLAIDDPECREAAQKALAILTGKDIAAMAQQERIQLITELLASKGGDSGEAASFLKSMETFSVASGDDGHHSASGSRDFSFGEASPSSNLEDDMHYSSCEQIPDSYLCPITHELMVEPVIAADGHTYERGAIEAWFRMHSSSPMTNRELPNLRLISNHVVERLIAKYVEGGK